MKFKPFIIVSASIGITVFLLNGCGIDVKAPKDMAVKVNFDAKELTQRLKQFTTNKVPPSYYKFLQGDELKTYLVARAKVLNAECVIPSKTMVEGENQGDLWVFAVHEKCYTVDVLQQKVLALSFDTLGAVNTATQAYEIYPDENPDTNITESSFEEFKNFRKADRLWTAATVIIPKKPEEKK